jgi:hypothetical protein
VLGLHFCAKKHLEAYFVIIILMEIKEAQQIFEVINNSNHKQLVHSLLKSAVRYSSIRVDWYFSDWEQRVEMENERTISHNAFISVYEILVRNMNALGEDTKWQSQIGSDRKSIGDFACLLHAVIGLKAR